jgi:Mrp family chromosome partitioning ATPase
LGEKLDGILFLVGLGKVSRDVAPQASRRIKATGVDVLGLICNQVNFPSRLNDYGYEYGYYYHYAYASGYEKAGTYAEGINNYVKAAVKQEAIARKQAAAANIYPSGSADAEPVKPAEDD